MKPIYRRILIFVLAVLVLVGGYFAYRVAVDRSNKVSQEFSESRNKGSIIAKDIVDSSNGVAQAIAKLNGATTTRAQVSSTIGEISREVSEIRSKALELSQELGVMATAVPHIQGSEAAKQAALKSISERVDLVEHLITYTDQVTRLTAAIRARIEKNAANNAQISALVRSINAEVNAINSLDDAANKSIEEFDSLLR